MTEYFCMRCGAQEKKDKVMFTISLGNMVCLKCWKTEWNVEDDE